MNTPKISILIANYNNGHFFKDCYDSLIAQTCNDFEVIILDDCSSDDSFATIQKIIENDSRFKLYKNETNKQVGFTKRRLVELANFEICGFLDPDDALKPKAIEIMLNNHHNSPNTGLIYSNFMLCNENLKELSVHYTQQINDLAITDFYNYGGEISHFATFKKSIYKKTLGINPYYKIAEDIDLYLKFVETAPSLHVNEILYLYRIHNDGISFNKDKAVFWHWVAIINAAERRGKDVHEFFYENFVRKSKYLQLVEKLNSLKNSRMLKILYKLGIFNAYKNL